MMVDEDRTTLTPSEAGAFVAQWAERREVEVSDLAKRLDVDETQAVSLLRQARGRLSMEKWLLDKQPRTAPVKSLIAPVIASLVIGGLAGAVAIRYFQLGHPAPDSSSQELPRPNYQVTTTQPSSGNGMRQPMPPPYSSYGRPSTGGPVTTTVSPGGPGAQANTGSSSGRAPNLNINVTKEVNTKVPADMVVLVVAGTDRYYVRGPVTKNYVAATQLKDNDLRVPIRDLVMYVMDKRAAKQHSGKQMQNNETGRILAGIGIAVASQPLLLREMTPNLHKHFADISAPMYAELSSTLMEQIRHGGPGLFMDAGAPIDAKN